MRETEWFVIASVINVLSFPKGQNLATYGRVHHRTIGCYTHNYTSAKCLGRNSKTIKNICVGSPNRSCAKAIRLGRHRIILRFFGNSDANSINARYPGGCAYHPFKNGSAGDNLQHFARKSG
jgi:hypothetical protein